MVDFIGLGAQKSGTSWIYACLYDHPEVCAPIKEIHFFSRPRFEKGVAWYEDQFKSCARDKKKGEFSTSYLYSKDAPERIAKLYPTAKLIAVLRNPIDRAISQYGNAIKAGEIRENMTFAEYVRIEESVLAQGMYAEQLERYYSHFNKDQILVLIYEDLRKDPEGVMRRIYAHLGVDTTFVSDHLHESVNVARAPRFVFVDRVMHHIAEGLRRLGLGALVWSVRNSGLTDVVRGVNTKKKPVKEGIDGTFLRERFRADVTKLSSQLGRNLNSQWSI